MLYEIGPLTLAIQRGQKSHERVLTEDVIINRERVCCGVSETVELDSPRIHCHTNHEKRLTGHEEEGESIEILPAAREGTLCLYFNRTETRFETLASGWEGGGVQL